VKSLLLSIDDLPDHRIVRILDQAAALDRGELRPEPTPERLLGLFFREASLRTRVGFAAAAARLGWHAIDIADRRQSPVAMAESWGDTLRTLSGYVDVLVCRPGTSLDEQVLHRNVDIPYVNAGSTGPEAEHPTQTLIDLYEMTAVGKDPRGLTIAVCGDLRMRAVRSLFKLLARPRWFPQRLVLVSLPELSDPADLPSRLRAITEERTIEQLEGVDVLYVAGIPHGAVPEPARTRLRLTDAGLVSLPADAIVLSPMPVIDEIDDGVRWDPRVRMFEQSRRGLYVRQAVLLELTRVPG